MKNFATIVFLLFSTVILGQNWRGIYKNKSCFCDNHSNATGWYLGAGVYGSQLSFQNNFSNDNTFAYGYGGFIGNKIKEQFSMQLGIYPGKVLPISTATSNSSRDFYWESYEYKHLNIPLSFIYKFRSEKRFSPYLLTGGEANLLRKSVMYSSGFIGKSNIDSGYNQFNVFLGGGSYILLGNHFGWFAQVSIDMNPFTNASLSNYNYAFTGKSGLTYHF